jgi:hypothetical protein
VRLDLPFEFTGGLVGLTLDLPLSIGLFAPLMVAPAVMILTLLFHH